MSPRPSPSLARLAARVAAERGGRRPSLEAELNRVFGAHEEAVRRIVRARLRGLPEQEVEELVQQVLFTAWQRLPSWRRDEAFGPWLFGVARNVCRNARRKRRDELLADGELDGEAQLLSALDQLQDEVRERVVLDAADEALDPLERQVVWLRWVEELDRAAVAEEVGLPDANAVRVVLKRSKDRLAKRLLERCAALGHGSSLLRGPSG